MAKDKIKKYDPKLKEDIASFKASFAFIIFCVIIFLTASNLETNEALYTFKDFLDHNMWLLVIPFGIFAISAALRILAAAKKWDESYSYFSTHDFLGLSSLFVVYTLTFTSTSNILMYSLVVVGFAVGYYAKRFFGPDFYTITLLNLAIAFGLWLKFGNKNWSTFLSKFSVGLLLAGAIVTVLLIAVFAFSRIFIKKPTILDKSVCIFGVTDRNDLPKLCMIPALVSIILGIALAIVLQFFPQYMTLLMAEIILLIQYVALGVIYTVRLINQ